MRGLLFGAVLGIVFLSIPTSLAVDAPYTGADAVVLSGVLEDEEGRPLALRNVAITRSFTCDATTCTRLEQRDFRVDVYTDEAGRWSASAPPGGLRVTGFIDRFDGRVFSEEDDLEPQTSRDATALPGERVNVNLTLRRQPPVDVEIRAQIVDAATGMAPPEAHLSAWNYAFGYLPASASASRGNEWVLAQRPGYMLVDAYFSPDELDAPTYGRVMTPLRAAAGEVRALFLEAQPLRSFEDVPSGLVEVSGLVLDDETGLGIQADIGVYNEEAFEWGRVASNADGTFRVNVRPGPLLFIAVAHGHLDAAANRYYAASASDWVELRLPPGIRPGSFCCSHGPDTYPTALGRFPDLDAMREPRLQTPEDLSLRQPWADAFASGVTGWTSVYNETAESFAALATPPPNGNPPERAPGLSWILCGTAVACALTGPWRRGAG